MVEPYRSAIGEAIVQEVIHDSELIGSFREVHAVRWPRLRFTVKRLMAAIAALALVLG